MKLKELSQIFTNVSISHYSLIKLIKQTAETKLIGKRVNLWINERCYGNTINLSNVYIITIGRIKL